MSFLIRFVFDDRYDGGYKNTSTIHSEDAHLWWYNLGGNRPGLYQCGTVGMDWTTRGDCSFVVFISVFVVRNLFSGPLFALSRRMMDVQINF